MQRYSSGMVAVVEVDKDANVAARHSVICDRLEGFCALEDGWDADSETSAAISAAVCDAARKIVGRVMSERLPLPYVYPMPEGGISLEWGLDDIGINAELSNNADMIDLMSWRRSTDDTFSAKFRVDDMDGISAWLAQQIGL